MKKTSDLNRALLRILCISPETADLIADRIEELEAEVKELKSMSMIHGKISVEPQTFSGHTLCKKCSKVHWMHGACPEQ